MSEEPRKRRRWLRWLRNGLIALVAFALVAVLALQYWIVPWIIRDQVRTELGRRWRGEVELDAVNFSFFGPIGLRGLTLSDTRGAQWLRVESVKIELSDWPGLSPKLRTVEVDAVHLDAYARDGAIDWPIQPAPPEEPPAEETDVSEYLDLRMIRIDAIDAAIRDQQGRTLQIPSLELTVTPEDDGYRARLAPRGGGSSPKADALLTQAGDLSATMRFSRHLAGEEMALLLRLAGLTDAEGQLELASDLRLTMREMNPETLEITGWTRAEDGRLEAGDQPVFEDLQARLDFQSRRVEVSSLSAATPGGTVSGSLQTTIPLGRELEYTAALSADKVPLALVRSYLPQLNLQSGWADVELDIAGTGLADIDVKARTSLTSRMQAGPVTAATGQMAIDARFTPPLGDAPLALQGQAQLTDWRLTGPERAEAEVPKLELTFDRQSVEAKPFALLLSDHPLEVSGSATLPAGGKPLSWQATLRSPTPLPVPVVTRWVGAELPETSVAMDLQARGQGVDSLHLTGGLDWETLLAGSVYRAGGKTRLDVRLTGLAEPERIKAFGRVIASDFEAGDDADPMLRADEIRVNLDGRSLRLEPARLSTPGGSMRLAGQADWPIGKQPSYQADIQAETFDLAALSRAIGPAASVPLSEAMLTGDFRLAATEDGSREITGSGSLSGQFTLDALTSAGGRFSLNMRQQGDQLPTGPLELSDWTVTGPEELKLRKIGAKLALADGNLRIADLTGQSDYGQISGDGKVALQGATTMEMTLKLNDFDIGAMSAAYMDPSPIARGQADLDLNVSLDDKQVLRVVADGATRAAASDRPARADGDLSVDVTVTDAMDAAKRSMAGEASLTGWTLRSPEGRILRDAALRATLAGKTIKITELTGLTARGKLAASGRIELTDDGPTYRADFDISGLDIPGVLALAPEVEGLREGDFSGKGTLTGRGLAQLAIEIAGKAEAKLTHETLRELGGDYQADVELTGPLTDMDQLKVNGTARMEQWRLVGPGGVIADELNLSMLLLGRSGDLSSLRGRVADGRITGRARLDLPPGAKPSYEGGAELKDVDVTKLVHALTDGEVKRMGTLDTRYTFRGRDRDFMKLHGWGVVTVKDMFNYPQVTVLALLQRLGVAPRRAGDFDVNAAFQHVGPLVTIDEARAATPVVAMTVEKGSTIHLLTHEVDAYVVAGLIDELNRFFSQIPLLRLTTSLTSRLSRLHVTGRWDDRASLRIRKTPLRDLSEGTIVFLRRSAAGGGQLGRDILSTLEDLAPWAP